CLDAARLRGGSRAGRDLRRCALRELRRPDGRRVRRRPRHDRRVDPHGLRVGEGRARARLRELAGGRGHDARGEEGRSVHALPACAPRRGSRRRSDRRSAERGLGGGREQIAHAEGADGISAARQGQERRRQKGEKVKGKVKKVVLAYSGGLDTSVILKWLQDTYGCEVVTFTADIGQGEELESARKKARKLGVKEIFVDDLREEFVRDFVFPMFRANAIYEGEYLLGTSIARPLIAKRQIEIARDTGADVVSHGATGKGNDQVRFALAYYALEPGIRVIAPWREWDLNSREKLLAYAEAHAIPIEMKHRGSGAPYSMDANLLHISYEGRALEDPALEPEEDMWRWTVSPEKAPDAAEYLELDYTRGDIAAINGKSM